MHLPLFALYSLLAVVTAQNDDGVPGKSDIVPPVSTPTSASIDAISTHTSISTITSYSTPAISYHSPPVYTMTSHVECDSDCGGVCGDGLVQAPYEDCDLGPKLNGAPQSGCDLNCQFCGYCGDGVVETPLGENCDLGSLNGSPNSGCSATCQCLPVCGDGKIQGDEQCDAGSLNGAYDSGCSKDCELCGYCGDGNIDDDVGETCDNGYLLNGSPGNPCSTNCTLNTCDCSSCGNGVLEPGEECDHGSDYNGKPWESCGVDCKWAASECGNGITEYPESCDDGDLNGLDSSHCTNNCTWKIRCGNPIPPSCGDGIVQWPEKCDEGWQNGQPGSPCTTDCEPCNTEPPRCGDGYIDPGEQCDDGVANGGSFSDCDTYCHSKSYSTCPNTCNPNPFYNKCTITTSCITTPSTNNFCACRAGYRASGLSPTDPKQFRLSFPGQEYRVFVAPGVECDELCYSPYPGPESCKEVPVQGTC